MYIYLKRKRIFKIILIIFPGITASWLAWFLFTFSCSLDSNKITGYFQCNFSLPLIFVLASIVSILSLVIAIDIFKNNRYYYYKKIIVTYFIVIFMIVFIFLSNIFLTEYQKIVYVGGMTFNSCEKGESIFPWGVTYGKILDRIYPDKYSLRDKERYSQECYLFHGKCGEVKDLQSQNRCYYLNIKLFKKKEDCAILSDGKYSSFAYTVRELCELDVKQKKDIQPCFLRDNLSEYKLNDFRLLNICMSNKINILFDNSTNRNILPTKTDSYIWRACRNQYKGVENDICISNFAWISKRKKVCDAISGNIPLLKKICQNSIK